MIIDSLCSSETYPTAPRLLSLARHRQTNGIKENKVENRGVFFGSGKAGVNAPHFTIESPHSRHKKTIRKTHFSQNTPQKRP
jgi:hypothetical protein